MHLFASNFCELKIIKHYVETYLDSTYVNFKKINNDKKHGFLICCHSSKDFFLRLYPEYLGCHENGPVLQKNLKKSYCHHNIILKSTDHLSHLSQLTQI